LAGEDAARIQDARYDGAEYLRAEVAAHPDVSESDVLELIASTYGAPDEVASAYRDTEARVQGGHDHADGFLRAGRVRFSACSSIRGPPHLCFHVSRWRTCA
jgi:hypothetical protein